MFDPGLWGCMVSETGHLQLDGCDLTTLARDQGTPMHVVSRKALVDNCVRAITAFQGTLGKAEVFYSYKTNCIPAVLQIIHQQGIGAEVISPYELWVALKLGLPGSRIIYNGPHKSRDSLETAVSNKLKLINVDSLTDLRALADVCRALNIPANVGVRLCPTGGWNAQFGLGINNGEAIEGFTFIEENKNFLRLKGLHLHLGSQVTDPALFAGAIDEALSFTLNVAGSAATKIEFIDVGGGYGVPTVREVGGIERRVSRLLGRPIRPPRPDHCPRLEDIAASIKRAMKPYAGRLDCGEATIIVEPGRSITSNTQILLLAVRAIKDRKPLTAILDGGKMNITYPTSFEYHHVLVANKVHEVANNRYKLVGRTCTPSDLVYDNVMLPELMQGDIIALMDAGAYFTSFSSDFAFARPPILMVDAGVARIIRQRETFDGIVSRDRLDWPGKTHSSGAIDD